jgi:hypothetical protein
MSFEFFLHFFTFVFTLESAALLIQFFVFQVKGETEYEIEETLP